MTSKPDHQALISAEQLQSSLGRDELRILDCRFDLMDPGAGHRLYLEGHVPGAVYANLDTDLSAPVGPHTGRHPLPQAAHVAQCFGNFGIDGSTQVVVYDADGGALAARAWWLLRWAGHDRVAVLDGGLPRWLSLGLPVSSGEERAVARHFSVSPRNEMILSLEELIANGMSGDGLSLLDARDEARYRGESEPIDAVAGHIPGAVNLPFSRFLREDGRCRNKEELREIWAATVGRDADAPSVAMCGSGVTACYLALTAVLAGYREPRVYVGSWSEWIREAARPVATGAG